MIARIRTLTWRSAYAHIFTHERLSSISEDETAEQWRQILAGARPPSRTLVAEVGGAIVGFASVGPSRSESQAREAELYAIYVLPEAQSHGVGRALMSEALDRLFADGFADAVLWVLEDNPRTRRFYELSSWRPDGSVKEEELLGTLVREVRYRITFEPTT